MLPPPRARIRDGSACFEKAPWSYLSVLYREMCRLWVSVLWIAGRKKAGALRRTRPCFSDRSTAWLAIGMPLDVHFPRSQALPTHTRTGITPSTKARPHRAREAFSEGSQAKGGQRRFSAHTTHPRSAAPASRSRLASGQPSSHQLAPFRRNKQLQSPVRSRVCGASLSTTTNLLIHTSSSSSHGTLSTTYASSTTYDGSHHPGQTCGARELNHNPEHHHCRLCFGRGGRASLSRATEHTDAQDHC